MMVCPLMTVSAFGLFLVSDFNLEPLPAAIITSFNYLNLISIIQTKMGNQVFPHYVSKCIFQFCKLNK